MSRFNQIITKYQAALLVAGITLLALALRLINWI
jgi:hypothetical protein